jgi:hypothetical protein
MNLIPKSKSFLCKISLPRTEFSPNFYRMKVNPTLMEMTKKTFLGLAPL